MNEYTFIFCALKFYFNFFTGDMVYNVTDGLGWCFVAFCNASCNVVTHSSPCPTTPIPSKTAHSTTSAFSTITKVSSSVHPTSVIPTSTSTASTILSTTTLDCNDVYPSRKVRLYTTCICIDYLCTVNALCLETHLCG